MNTKNQGLSTCVQLIPRSSGVNITRRGSTTGSRSRSVSSADKRAGHGSKHDHETKLVCTGGAASISEAALSGRGPDIYNLSSRIYVQIQTLRWIDTVSQKYFIR